MKHLARWSSLVGLVAVSLAALGHVATAYRFARAVLTPPGRKLYDLSVLALGYERDELASVALPLTDDTVLQGLYSLISHDSRSCVTLGEVLTVQPGSVIRRVIRQTGHPIRVGTAVRFNGWMALNPEGFSQSWRSLLIEGPLGRVPAWHVPTEQNRESQRWAIHIHGRSASRAETLRGIEITRLLGFENLACSYRNDLESVPGETGRYALGAEEWRDIEVALEYAVRQGAQELVLYGWSMGGAIALQLLKQSRFRHLVTAVILDSPVLDWESVLNFHGQLSKLPSGTIQLGMRMIERGVVRAGVHGGISLETLAAKATLAADHPPILILHSSDDGYVPIEPAIALAESHDRVTLKRFEVARHCKLWNFDQDEYVRTVSGWLQPMVRASS